MIWILLLFSTAAMAQDSYFSFERVKSLSINGGNWMEYYKQTQATESGELNGMGFKPFLSIIADYSINDQYYLHPEIGYVIRQRINDQTNKDHFFFRSDLSYKFKPYLSFLIGSSLMIKSYSGTGGEKELDNGSGTETFFAPSERKSTYNQTLDFGLAVHHEKFTFKFYNYIYSFNNEDEKLNSFSISMSHPLWENI